MTFRTGGREVPAVTADEMRAVDEAAVDAGLDLPVMMENAGRDLAAAARAFDPDHAAILAGAGGNGGGGLAAARHLLNHGVDVAVVLDRVPGDLSGAPATQWRLLDAMGVARRESVPDADLVVDALVGYGLTAAPRGRVADLVEAANAADAPVLSLDVPTGVDATTGERPGVAVEPDRTLTLALPKTGLRGVAPLELGDIGIPPFVFAEAGVAYESPFEGEYRLELSWEE